jgi:hypothetical protein
VGITYPARLIAVARGFPSGGGLLLLLLGCGLVIVHTRKQSRHSEYFPDARKLASCR